MINPSTVFEDYMYSTLRISGAFGTGTGAVFMDEHFEPEQNINVGYPILLTNWHVVEGEESIRVTIHTHAQPDQNSEITGNIDIEIDDLQNLLIRHPNPEIDLVAIPIGSAINRTEAEHSVHTFAAHYTRFSLATEDDKFDALEPVLMIGYPIGLYDSANNYPIFRSGVTATHPKVDFEGRPIGAIDIAAFPGSSGSPVVHTSSHKVLGMLYAGPQMNANGSFDIVEVPTKQIGVGAINIPIHIGYYIKAREVGVMLDHAYKTMKIPMPSPPR